MKIILINLFAPFTGSKYTSGLTHLEPIGLEYVGAVAHRNGHDVRILSPSPSEDLIAFSKRVGKLNPDIVGIGPATYNFNQAKMLSRLVKSQCKHTVAIFGGYHVTALPEEVADPAIDIAIQGEGENTFSRIVSFLQRGISYESVSGISYCKNEGEIVVNPRQKRIAELDNLPYPLRSKQDMETYKCGGIYYPTASLQRSTAQVVYSRGCPHLCPYCSSKNMWGTAVIYRDPVRVAEEIEYLIDSFGTNLIFFADLTFNLNKKRVLDLCTVLIERNIKVSWFCACRTEGIDKELLSAMKEAGCTRIHFGVEAIDEHSLKKIKRKKTYESIQESLEKTSKIGIITRGYLMIGYPWETREHLESINKNLNQLYIDDLRISFFTPYPGSDIYKQSAGKTMSIDWDNYTSDKPLYRLKGLTTSEILELRNRIFFGFYASSTYIDRLKEKLVNYPHLHDSFKEFFQELGVRVLLDVLKTSKEEDRYRQAG